VIEVTVKLFATLTKKRFGKNTKKYPDGITIRQVIDKLNVSKDQVAIIFVNNRQVKLDQELFNKDVLALFPPIGGG